jgi:hypothetical protein
MPAALHVAAVASGLYVEQAAGYVVASYLKGS